MRDISNKLHAMVDEFVSKLSLECDSLANNISGHAQKHAPHDSGAEAAKTPRLSNRTTMEVLNGLRRPSSNPPMDNHHQDGKSHVELAKSNLTEGNTRNRDGGRFVWPVREMKPRSASLEGTDTQNDARSVDIGSKYTLSEDEAKQGRGTNEMNTIGKFMQTIEILSSDQSSDDCLLTNMKYSKNKKRDQSATKIKNLSSRGRPSRIDIQSPSMSRESSHLMNYSYEEDTNNLGGRNQAIETTFPKLR